MGMELRRRHLRTYPQSGLDAFGNAGLVITLGSTTLMNQQW